MSRLPALLCLLALQAPAARAADPDEEWAELPAEADTRAQPAAEPEPLPPPPESPARAAWRARVRALSAGLPPPPLVVERLRAAEAPAPQLSRPGPLPLVKVDEPVVTLLGGLGLQPGQWAGGASLGLPTVDVRLHRGLGDGWDVGLGYGGLYGQSHELSVRARRAFSASAVEWALGLEASAVLFSVRPSSPPSGARAITGRRNFNVAPTLHLSGHTPRTNVRWLGVAQLVISLDTEPVAVSPLGGVPPAFSPGWNVPLLAGGEWAVGGHAVFQLLGGFEVHGRTGDVPLMPVVRVGILFGS